MQNIFKLHDTWFIVWIFQSAKCAFLTFQYWALASSFTSWASISNQDQPSFIITYEIQGGGKL